MALGDVDRAQNGSVDVKNVTAVVDQHYNNSDTIQAEQHPTTVQNGNSATDNNDKIHAKSTRQVSVKKAFFLIFIVEGVELPTSP